MSWESGGYEWTPFRDANEPACLIFLLLPCGRQAVTEPEPVRPKVSKRAQAKAKAH